jgi:SAM-dependent methyltransferase
MDASNVIPVAETNTDQFRAWDGAEGTYWAEHAEYFDRSALPFHRRLLTAAAIAEDERVLDIGCGTGQASLLAAQAATAGAVLGVDLSSPMLDYARRRADAEGAAHVTFEQGDAQIHPFESGAFDVAISNAGATFFGDLVAGFANVARALRPGGRLVLLTWQPLPQNEWIRAFRNALAVGRDLPPPPPDAPNPFALADADRVQAVLAAAGFVDIDLQGAHEAMWFGDDADDAYQFVIGLLGWMLDGLDDAGKVRARDDLRASTAAHETADGVFYDSALWIIRAVRPTYHS